MINSNHVFYHKKVVFQIILLSLEYQNYKYQKLWYIILHSRLLEQYMVIHHIFYLIFVRLLVWIIQNLKDMMKCFFVKYFHYEDPYDNILSYVIFQDQLLNDINI